MPASVTTSVRRYKHHRKATVTTSVRRYKHHREATAKVSAGSPSPRRLPGSGCPVMAA